MTDQIAGHFAQRKIVATDEFLEGTAAFGYVPQRGGERAGSAAGDALTRLSRRRPQRGHAKTSRANTQRSSAAHRESPLTRRSQRRRGPVRLSLGAPADRHAAACGASTP